MRLTLISLGILAMAAGQALAVTPTHRWSFATDYTDSIGGATAVAVGSATITDGKLDLSANDGRSKGGYATIPVTPEIFGYTSGSFEAWATWQGGDNWQSIAGFGTSEAANLSLIGAGDNSTGLDFYTSTGGATAVGPAMVRDTATHIMGVMDAAAGQARLYINGAFISSQPLGTWSFASMGADAGPAVAYIGNDIWTSFADPTFKGLVDEFRIYNVALTDAQVSASFAAGADAAFGFHPGDANGDGMVDVGDLGILGFNYGTATGATWGMADFTGDGAVDVGDLGILGFNYGFGTAAGAVPEPATMSLLALGVVGLIRRRR